MGTLRPHDFHQMAPIFFSPGRDVECSGSLDRPLRLKLYRTVGRFAEELHDRGLIEPRSRRDRAAIVDLPSWIQGHDLGARFQPKKAREEATIETRSPRDRGPIAA